jgi:hypothetical protein
MTGLTLNKPYAVGVIEYNGTGTATNYYISYTQKFQYTTGAATEPTVASSGITIQVFSAPDYAVNLSWQNGNGSGRIVLVRPISISDAPLDGYTYAFHNNYSVAPLIGSNRTVYNGSSNQCTIYGLSRATSYAVSIFEYNGQGDPINYLTSSKGQVTIPAQSQAAQDQHAILDNLSFQYRYDSRNRMIAKKVPGAEWTYMVYDNRDRLVLTQDGNLRTTNRWSFTKYDALNRAILTGIMTAQTMYSVDEMQKIVNDYYTQEEHIMNPTLVI